MVRLKGKLAEQDFRSIALEFFEPTTNAVEGTSEALLKESKSSTKKNNSGYEIQSSFY